MIVETQKRMDVSPLPGLLLNRWRRLCASIAGESDSYFGVGLAAFSLTTLLTMIVVDLWLELIQGVFVFWGGLSRCVWLQVLRTVGVARSIERLA